MADDPWSLKGLLIGGGAIPTHLRHERIKTEISGKESKPIYDVANQANVNKMGIMRCSGHRASKGIYPTDALKRHRRELGT